MVDQKEIHNQCLSNDLKERIDALEELQIFFVSMPDKQQEWNDLIRLTSDEESDVRSRANHSLGRISIFKASQAKTDKDYKEELEKAIEFFGTAALEASYFNPAQFCLPFYRSFYAIIFEKQEAKKK